MPEFTEIKIGGTKLRVPIYETQEDTRRLADALNKRIKHIEQQAPRIDTLAFTLQAAFELAVELEDAKQAHRDETRDILLALDAIATRLEELLAAARKPPTALPPETDETS